MIHVDRSRVAAPKPLAPLRAAGLAHARQFFSRRLRERRQERYYNPHWAKAYRVPIPSLAKLFHRKCAFCESKIEDLNVPGVLDHLRPKWGTRGLGRDYSPDHYWWLAYDWSNLYLTCVECNKQRGPRFPVKGRRLSGPGVDVAGEVPLLIDPCRDDPREHLTFGYLYIGVVGSSSSQADGPSEGGGVRPLRDRPRRGGERSLWPPATSSL